MPFRSFNTIIFKLVALNTDSEHVLCCLCDVMTENLSIRSAELGSHLRERIGHFYCTDIDIAKKYGFAQKNDVIKAIQQTTEASFAACDDWINQNKQFFGQHSTPCGDIIFVDLVRAEKELCKIKNKTLNEQKTSK